MQPLILISFYLFAAWLIKRDIARRPGVSAAIWFPTIWFGIMSSRPVTAWLGFGGSFSTLDGSPVDRMFYLSMIVAGWLVLFRRNLYWGGVMTKNWPVFLFYAYLLISVLWANSPVVSFKRWFKESGNIVMVLVILSEVDPLQAIRAVFVRCAYVLIPLSIIFIRWIPHLGRNYGADGNILITGVATQKNSLGNMALVCMLILIWDMLQRFNKKEYQGFFDRYFSYMLLAVGVWLLDLSDSKTSIACLAIGVLLLASTQVPVLHRRVSTMGGYVLAAVIVFFMVDQMLGVTEFIVASMGRDMTFTGRTLVWRELLNLHTDPILGTGYLSFWDSSYMDRLPKWIAGSAHNGYLEVFLAGGGVGLAFLALMLLVTSLRLNRALREGTVYATLRFAVFVVMLMANLTESNFACMSPLGFLFLVVTFAPVPHSGRASVFGAEQNETVASSIPVEPDPKDLAPYPTFYGCRKA